MNIQFAVAPESRTKLLERFPPKYPEVRCDHITVAFGVADNTALPEAPKAVEVIGYATDNAGLECLVVEVDGTTKRADGLVYHITLSRLESRKSVESNDVIKAHGWKTIERLAITVSIKTTD